MGVPVTTGQLRTDIQTLNVGDYIACYYNAASGVAGVFSNLGGVVGTEIPVAGATAPAGWFYFIKVAPGTLVADRIVQHSVSYITLYNVGYITGKDMLSYLAILSRVRSLTGGQLEQVDGVVWPANEFDKYIKNSPFGTVWNDTLFSWTSSVYPNTETFRVGRKATVVSPMASSTANNTAGFRPVMEYLDSSIEVSRRPVNFYY